MNQEKVPGWPTTPEQAKPAHGGRTSSRVVPRADWLREQYELGLSVAQIARGSGWSDQFIRDRLLHAGVVFRRSPGNATNGRVLDEVTLTALVAEGRSAAQIATRTGYSRTGVYKLLKRAGLTVQPPKRLEDPAVLEEVRRLYDQGNSVSQIGRTLGHGEDWVRARLHAAGVQLRPTRRGPRRALDPARVRQLVDEGHTVPQIAALTDRSPARIYELVRANGWSAAPPPRRPRAAPLDGGHIRRLYEVDRVSIVTIAHQLGCSTDRVRAALTDQGVPIRVPGQRGDHRPAPITSAQLRQLYVEQDLTISEVAIRLGCSDTRVAAALDRHQIPRHPRPRRRQIVPVAIDRATLTRLYVNQKLDDIAIAARYDVPPLRIRQRREELGVRRPAVPPPHGPPVATPPAQELEQLYLVDKLPLVVIARRTTLQVRSSGRG